MLNRFACRSKYKDDFCRIKFQCGINYKLHFYFDCMNDENIFDIACIGDDNNPPGMFYPAPLTFLPDMISGIFAP